MIKIGVIATTEKEMPIVQTYNKINDIETHESTTFGNVDYTLASVVAGQGQKNMKKATENMLSNYDPDHLIHIGFCATTDPELNIGDLILATSIRQGFEEVFLRNDCTEYIKELVDNTALKLHHGKIQSFNNPKLTQRKVYNDVLGIDIEAFTFAKIAEEYGVSAAVIKSVTNLMPKSLSSYSRKNPNFEKIKTDNDTARKGLNLFALCYMMSHDSIINGKYFEKNRTQ